MDIEREIMAWVTRADMLIISAWRYILVAAILCAMMLLAWTISACMMKTQREAGRDPDGRR